MIRIPPDEGRSWWLREALGLPEFAGEAAPALDGDATADVVILGGGYTGLWTAWFVKQLDPGADVVVLEQDICGGGPSGRNGGFVNSFWEGIDLLCAWFGDRAAIALCEAGEESVHAIGTFCEAQGVDTWFRAEGTYTAATSTSQVGEWADQVLALDRLGLGDTLTVLGPEEFNGRIASPTFRGGTYSRFGATVHPARLARAIRNAAMAAGVRIHEQTPVTRFGIGSPVVAETPGGTVRAGAGVVAVNAWAQHWRRFRRAITVRGSYIVMTAPAPELLEEIGWTGGEGLADFRAALHYLRTTPDGRIAFGIGGMQPDLARTIDPRYAYDADAIRVAVEDLHRMFPSFADVPIESGWGGPIDVAGLHEPFFGTFEEGTVHYGLGYTGNGVGPSHLGGQILAHRALGRSSDLLALPLVDLEPKRFPPEPIRSPGMLVANHAIHRRDRALDDDLEPNPLTDFVARLPRRLGYNLGP
ncbi:MAG TPA: FAD-binding oxidoreductase [Actinomycetota bacterium]